MRLSWVSLVCSFLIACSHWEPAKAAVAPVIEAIRGHTMFSDGPHWDSDTEMLYYVDIFGKSVNRYDPNSTIVTSVELGQKVSVVIPIQGEADKFLITLEDKIAVMCWDGESPRPSFVRIVGTIGKPGDGITVNDGKADVSGVFWAGTFIMRERLYDFVPEAGVLLSLSKWRMPQIHARKFTWSNGISWNVDNTQLYFADSALRVIYAFDFDCDQSQISNPRVVFDFKLNGVEGVPGGITTDSDDRLWIACYNGGRIIQIDPSKGCLLRTVSIPSIQVTSVAFGGCDLDELYVTSANLYVDPKVLHKYPAPGCIFRVTGLGAQGLTANRVNL